MTIKEFDTPRRKRSNVMRAKSVDAKARTLDATISTNQVDRDGEIVEPSAFQDRIDTYMSNPVFLWMHQQDKPIGNVRDLDIKEDRIDAVFQFREEGKSELVDDVFGLYEDGTLKTFSIGFRVFRMEFEADEAGQNLPPRITDAELYEVSAVSIPANPGAVAKYLELGIVDTVARDYMAPGREDGEILKRALDISRTLMTRKIMGDGVPADQWALVQRIQGALFTPTRVEQSDDHHDVLANLNDEIQRLISGN